jgi:TonB family protein
VEQQSIIRYWTRREADIQLASNDLPAERTVPPVETDVATLPLASTLEAQTPRRHFRISSIIVVLALVVLIGAIVAWRHWQKEWADLEGKVPAEASQFASPQLQVPADEMRRHLTHEVHPEYPEAARQAALQGKVVIDAIVSPAGAVTETKVLSGDPILANAATDAVRWWRYDPYLVNGKSVPVETTITIDFRLKN